VLAALALWSGGAEPATARTAGKAQPVEITPQSSSGTAGVTIAAIVRTERYVACTGSASHLGVTNALPRLRTSRDDGAGRWQWNIARGVGAGWWRIAVTCRTSGGTHRDAVRIRTAAGPAGRAVHGRLFAPGSLHADDHTTGSGGAGNPYPPGQCTWWAWRKRQDLPFFPGIAGDALNWTTSAKRRHVPTGVTPVAGAIAVFAPGRFGAGYLGHVAYVESVAGDRIRISEAGFEHTPPGHRRTVSARGLTFIYGGPAGDGKGHPTKRPKSTPVTPQPGVFIHHVRRACANGHCQLVKRDGPGDTDYGALGSLFDDTEIGITCQMLGEPTTGTDGSGSSVWDRLTDLSFIPDYYVDTPGGTAGTFSAPIPPCVPSPPFFEQEGHLGADTYAEPSTAAASGPRIPPGAVVIVSCRVYAPQTGSAQPDGYWYRIGSGPWWDYYYAPANTFMNGDPWSGPFIHNTDGLVSTCG
jgi:surface antigen